MTERASQVAALAAELDVTAVVLGLPANVLWLTGFDMIGTFYFTAALVPCEGAPALLVHRAELDMARSESRAGDVVAWGHGDDHVDALVAWLEARVGSLRGRRLGVELDGWLRPRDLDAIGVRAGVEWVDVGARVEALRARMGAAELARCAEAGRVADMTVAAGAGAVAVGVTEHAVAAAALRTYVAAGGQEQPVPLSVRSGPRLAIRRALPSARPVELGDAVCIEAWTSLRRDAAVAASTVVAGAPSEPLLRAWRAVDAIFELVEGQAAMTGAELADRAHAAARALEVELANPVAFGLAFPYPLRPTTSWTARPGAGAPDDGWLVCVAPSVTAGATAVFAARTYAVGGRALEPLTHRPRLWSAGP